MKITVLVENRANRDNHRLVPEWGLSLHIAYNGHSILFDMGKSGVFAQNAEYLSIDLASVDIAVLSHHHFDHGGGMGHFLEINSQAKVYCGVPPSGECFVKLLGFINKRIGLEETLAKLPDARLKMVASVIEVLPNVFIIPHIKGGHPKALGNKNLFLKEGADFIPDDFAHEILMVIKEGEGIVVFTGCSHNGVLNMLDAASQECKGLPIKALVGGFHLASPPFNFMAEKKFVVQDMAKAVLEYPVAMTYTGHCTGERAFAVLQTVMGRQIRDIRTGDSFEIH